MSISLSFLLFFILFHYLKHIRMLLHFAQLDVFPSVYWLVTEAAFCRRHPTHPSSALPSAHQLHALRMPLYRVRGTFCCGRLSAVGGLLGMSGHCSGWLLGLALCEGC